MRKGLLLLAVLVCANFGYSQTYRNTRVTPANGVARTSAAAKTESLPIRRVILYSNGVAYIERRGMVSGNAEIDLSFKQSQVDDVLKSMVVLDLGQGRIGSVSYNSSQPASARTAEIPFGVDASTEEGNGEMSGMAGVLAQLQGARVMVTSAKGTAAGSILTVEKRKIAFNGKSSSEDMIGNGHSLVVASDNGEITAFDLADIRSVKLLDEGARRDINEFANATASTRRRDAKTITITSSGAGQREMVVSYTVAAPTWKTTYRVVLDEEGKPFFQGWAIVDNVSEEDWKDVSLSLISGSPVSFIQNLQKPLYRYRPIVPIPEDLELTPQIYDPETGSGYGDGIGDGSGSGRGSGAPPPALHESVEVSSNNFMQGDTSISTALTEMSAGVVTAAKGRELGDLFEYRIETPVTVERDRSALIPIVQTKMDGERVSIYNESARQGRPMGGMMLENTTTLTFEGGSLTVLDRDAYAGEALMERLKPQEKRLISFALDLGTRISSETDADTRPVQMIRVVDGVFQAHYFKIEKKTYTLTNQTDRKKAVYIEHPVRGNWNLAEDSAQPETKTERYYRFRIELEPFGRTVVPVIERQGLMDSYRLSSFTRDNLNLFISRRYVDESTKQRLEKLIDLRSQINQMSVKEKILDDEVGAIAADQKRLRENIEALAKTAEAKQLITRYIAKANEQESRLEEIEKEKKAVQVEKERLERELALEIRNFEVK